MASRNTPGFTWDRQGKPATTPLGKASSKEKRGPACFHAQTLPQVINPLNLFKSAKMRFLSFAVSRDEKSDKHFLSHPVRRFPCLLLCELSNSAQQNHGDSRFFILRILFLFFYLCKYSFFSQFLHIIAIIPSQLSGNIGIVK